MARHEVPDTRDRLEYAALVALLGWLRLPPARAIPGRGRRLGRFVSRAVPIRREVALENLRRSFPEWPPERALETYRGMCEIMGQSLADFSRFGASDPGAISTRIQVSNLEAVTRALDPGRGALLLTAHFGNWELLGAAVAVTSGHPLTALGGRQRNPLVERLLGRYREQIGLPNIVLDKSLRQIVRVLNQGKCLATLADQDGGPEGFNLPFLGRGASVQSGLFRLLARRGTPMVTGFCIRDGDRWRGELHDPEFPRAVLKDSPELEDEARRLASIYTSRVEAYVRRYPDHWFWVHRRWRTRLKEGGAPADNS